MIISDIKSQRIEEYEELSANISPETNSNGNFSVWFRIPQELGSIPISGDPFLAGFLIACMYVGESLHIDAPVSKRLLRKIPEIQSLIISWYPEFKEIPVTCRETDVTSVEQQNLGTACCFSGGVDSWYSLLKNQEDISHLILVQGTGGKNKNVKYWESQKKTAEIVASSFNKKLIMVSTNLRQQTDMKSIFRRKEHYWGKPYLGEDFYGNCTHGSFLAAIGLCLRGRISEFIIPSTHPYSLLKPWGSHPLLDNLWSVENLVFIHDGCEASRLEKIQQQVAKSTLALKNLKVCPSMPQNTVTEFNCCQCEKCLRTMIQLRLCGVLNQATTFAEPLDLQKFKIKSISNIHTYHYPLILNEAKAIGDTEVVEAVEIALGKKFSFERFYYQKIKPIFEQMQSIFKAGNSKKVLLKIKKLIRIT